MKIGFDLDDVLTESLPKFLEAFGLRFGTPVPLEEAAWDLSTRIPGIPLKAYKEFLEDLKREDFFAKVALHPGAKRAVEQLSTLGHRLFVITGRHPLHQEATFRWLKEQGLLQYFEAVFHREGEDALKSKREAILRLKLDVFIEDELPVAIALADLTLTLLLFDRPWNRAPLPFGIRRIHSWPEALRVITTLDGGDGKKRRKGG